MKEQKIKFQESVFFKHFPSCVPMHEALMFLETIAYQNNLKLSRAREFIISTEILDRSINYN